MIHHSSEDFFKKNKVRKIISREKKKVALSEKEKIFVGHGSFCQPYLKE